MTRIIPGKAGDEQPVLRADIGSDGSESTHVFVPGLCRRGGGLSGEVFLQFLQIRLVKEGDAVLFGGEDGSFKNFGCKGIKVILIFFPNHVKNTGVFCLR